MPGTSTSPRSDLRNKIWVGNLPKDVTSDDLRRLFSPFGAVKGVRLGNKDYGFVEFDNPQSVKEAIDEKNGKNYRGGKLVVSFASTRTNSRGFFKNQHREQRRQDFPAFRSNQAQESPSKSPISNASPSSSSSESSRSSWSPSLSPIKDDHLYSPTQEDHEDSKAESEPHAEKRKHVEDEFSKEPVIKRNKSFHEIEISKVQDFWDQRPCNIRHSQKEVGSKTYFDEVEQRKYFVEPHIPKFAQFSLWKNKKVLEIGCGIGTELINFCRAEADVTAIDISSRSLELCKKRLEAYQFKARLYEGNAEILCNILPPEEKFDLIWSFGCIHHTPHPEKVIDQLRKLLKPDGEIRIMVYSKVSWKLFFLMKETGLWDFSKLNQIIGEYSEAQSGSPVSYTYTFDEISNLFQGFQILEMRKDHIFPYKIDEYKNYQYVKEDCWKNVPEEAFRQLERELGWHTLVRAKLQPADNSIIPHSVSGTLSTSLNTSSAFVNSSAMVVSADPNNVSIELKRGQDNPAIHLTINLPLFRS